MEFMGTFKLDKSAENIDVLCEVCGIEDDDFQLYVTATHYCGVCNKKLCKNCVEGHMFSHKTELAKGLPGKLPNVPYCRGHPLNQFRTYCFRCETLLCEIDHHDHKTELIQDHIGDGKIEILKTKCNQRIEKIQSSLNAVNATMQGDEALQIEIQERHRKINTILTKSAETEFEPITKRLKLEQKQKASLETELEKCQNLTNQSVDSLKDKITMSVQMKTTLKKAFNPAVRPIPLKCGGNDVIPSFYHPVIEWKKPQLKYTLSTQFMSDRRNSFPVKIAFSSGNHLAVIDNANTRVKVYLYGKYYNSFSCGKMSPHGGSKPFTDIWGAAYRKNRLILVNVKLESGSDVMFFGETSYLLMAKCVPNGQDVAVHKKSGHVYVLTNRDCFYVIQGNSMKKVYVTQNGQLLNLASAHYMYVDEDENRGEKILFTSKGHNRLYIVNKDGIVFSTYGAYGHGPNEFDGITGVCVDPHGNVVVADQFHDRLHLLTPKGEFICHLLEGDVSRPQAVLFDNNGNLIVSEMNSGLIKTFSYDIKRVA